VIKLKISRARIQIAGVVAVGILLTACNPGPRYIKPPAQTPTAFKEAPPQDYKEGEGWKIAQPGDDKLRSNWWEVYNDKQLNVLEEQVKVSNQTIAADEANYRSARALVVSARSALFPTVGAGVSYTNSKFSTNSRTSVVGTSAGATGTSTGTSGTTGSTGTTTGTTTTTGTGTTTSSSTGTAVGSSLGSTGAINTYELPIDVSYTVDLWHKVRNTIAANTLSAQASAADIATALLSTQAALAEDYFEIRALDAERKVLDNTLDNYRRSLELTQTLYKTGIDSDQDVSQAQTQLDTATAQETDLGVSRAQYEHAIAMLIGRPPAGFSIEVAPFIPKPPDVPLALPSELLERRPDIASAERLVASANAQIGVAKAAYYPQLTLSATGGLESSSFLNWFTWPSRFWSLGPQLAQTLLDGGARRAATEQAQASYDAAVANYRQTVLTVFQGVEDSLAALRILSTEVGQQHTAVTSSTHYLDLAQTRYKAGVDSYLNVITAQTTVLTNRETEVTIQLRQMTASVQLILALGGGWDISQLPKAKDMLVKVPKWTPNGPPQTVTPVSVTAPNPPPMPAQQ
jgi:NodT family efflux transporter outer membrane factor (OMF) lipoprotein